MKPDFAAMSGQQLVDAYNKLAGTSRKAKFDSKADGVAKCEVLWGKQPLSKSHELMLEDGAPPEILRTATPQPAKEDTAPATNEYYGEKLGKAAEEASVQKEADARWRNWVPTREHPTRPRKSSFANVVRKERRKATKEAKAAAKVKKPAAKVKGATTKKGRAADGKVVRVLKKENPYREETAARKHFDAMVGSPTVEQYIAKFPAADRLKSRQYLTNAVRDGHAELLG